MTYLGWSTQSEESCYVSQFLYFKKSVVASQNFCLVGYFRSFCSLVCSSDYNVIHCASNNYHFRAVRDALDFKHSIEQPERNIDVRISSDLFQRI